MTAKISLPVVLRQFQIFNRQPISIQSFINSDDTNSVSVMDVGPWRQIVEKDCRARGLNREDAMDRARWRKLIGMIDDYDESSG